MTVSSINISNMERFVALGKKIHVKYVSLNKYIADKDHPSHILKPLSSLQHDEFLKIIYSLKKLMEMNL